MSRARRREIRRATVLNAVIGYAKDDIRKGEVGTVCVLSPAYLYLAKLDNANPDKMRSGVLTGIY